MQTKGNFLTDNDDLIWHYRNRCDFAKIFELVPQSQREAIGVGSSDEFRDTWYEILKTIGEYCGTVLQTNADAVSKEHLGLKDGDVVLPPAISENIRIYKEIGGPPLVVSSEYGGIGAPNLIEFISGEMIARACPSTLLNVLWYGSIALIIEKFGSEELKQKYVPQLAAGEISGSMSLTEPDVGSDLANVRSYGVDQGDGTWKLYGNKQFISNGGAAISLVLAKNEKGAKGLKSLNLFLCPRMVDGKHNFKVAKLEDKPGLHGSATCALEFDGSIAYLLGNSGEGFVYMLHLMNEARLAVAFQAIGLMEASWRTAKDFASQRRAFGVPIEQHELIAERLLDMEVETKALRSISFQAGYYQSLIEVATKALKDPQLDDKKRDELNKLISKSNKKFRDLTPLVKWLGGERAFYLARECLQIHGGYGFTTEYKPEWYVRESLILSIYEGTSQIQALMCLKDTLKSVMRDPKGFAEVALGVRLKKLSESDPLKKKVYNFRQLLNSAILAILFKLVKEHTRSQYNANKEGDILKLVKALSKDILQFKDLSPALLHAERITEMKAITSEARCLVWDAEVDPSRAWIAERFLNKYLPVMTKLKLAIESHDPVIENRLAKVRGLAAADQ